MMGGRWRGSVKFEESHDSSGRENHPSHPKSHLKHVLQNEGGIIWNHLKAFRFCQFLACFSSPNCVQCISMLSSLGDNPPGSFWATEKKNTPGGQLQTLTARLRRVQLFLLAESGRCTFRCRPVDDEGARRDHLFAPFSRNWF